MAKVDIYTTLGCGYCIRAKRLLDEKCVEYTEYDAYRDRDEFDRIRDVLPSATFPQILIDGAAIGGCDELYDLERRGLLDGLLT